LRLLLVFIPLAVWAIARRHEVAVACVGPDAAGVANAAGFRCECMTETEEQREWDSRSDRPEPRADP
jgi:hypothetical protein